MYTEVARAKINLTLEVLGKRSDGYHELRSMVAFADFGDVVSFTPQEHFELGVDGPFGDKVVGNNLITRAADYIRFCFPDIQTGKFHLQKNLPVSSGIGGGSADAAAAIRLLLKKSGIALQHLDYKAIASTLGADVPVCLEQKVVMMEGIGERLSYLQPMPEIPVVLVNPGVPVSTAEIFKILNAPPPGKDNGAQIPEFQSVADIVTYLEKNRNDLQPVASTLQPVVNDVLDLLLSQDGCKLARMSGSGATCFGVFDHSGQVDVAVQNIISHRAGWWVRGGKIQ